MVGRDPLAVVVVRGGERQRRRGHLARALHLGGRPPVKRFGYWVASEECTIRCDNAREG